MPKLTGMNLFLFTVDQQWGHDVVAAGAAGIVVDWERRGKARRQAGEDTQISTDTPADLSRMRAAFDGRLLCRVNGYGEWTGGDGGGALGRGGGGILLPVGRTTGGGDRIAGGRGTAAGPRPPPPARGGAPGGTSPAPR